MTRAKAKLHARFGDPLTKAERKVLTALSLSDPAKVVARVLNVSERTVNFHCANAYAKLKVNNLIQACLKAGILERVEKVKK